MASIYFKIEGDDNNRCIETNLNIDRKIRSHGKYSRPQHWFNNVKLIYSNLYSDTFEKQLNIEKATLGGGVWYSIQTFDCGVFAGSLNTWTTPTPLYKAIVLHHSWTFRMHAFYENVPPLRCAWDKATMRLRVYKEAPDKTKDLLFFTDGMNVPDRAANLVTTKNVAGSLAENDKIHIKVEGGFFVDIPE